MNLLRELIDAARYNRYMGELSTAAQIVCGTTLAAATISAIAFFIWAIFTHTPGTHTCL